MRKNQIVKFLSKDNERLAICDGEKYYTLYQTFYGKSYYTEVKIDNPKPTRVKPEIRELYEKTLKAIKEIERQQKIISDAQGILDTNKDVIYFLGDALDRANGLMTKDEFGNRVLKELNLKGCEFEIYPGKFIIEKTTDIEKWYRGALAYEEYDGSFHIASLKSEEAKKEYDYFMKRYSHKLPIKADYDAYFSIGDKRWLYLNERYSIDFNKSLSEENCLKLVKKIRGH